MRHSERGESTRVARVAHAYRGLLDGSAGTSPSRYA